MAYCTVVRGFPEAALVVERIATFAINVVTIALVALAVYAWAGMRREDVSRFRKVVGPGQ